MKLPTMLFLNLLVLLLIGCGDQSGRTVEAFERLRDGAGETVEALRDLTEAQRDVFLEKSEEYLADLDERIAELRESAAEDAAERLEELQQRREELAPRIEALRESSAEAWSELSGSLVDQLERFRDADGEPR